MNIKICQCIEWLQNPLDISVCDNIVSQIKWQPYVCYMYGCINVSYSDSEKNSNFVIASFLYQRLWLIWNKYTYMYLPFSLSPTLPSRTSPPTPPSSTPLPTPPRPCQRTWTTWKPTSVGPAGASQPQEPPAGIPARRSHSEGGGQRTEEKIPDQPPLFKRPKKVGNRINWLIFIIFNLSSSYILPLSKNSSCFLFDWDEGYISDLEEY